MTGLPTLTWTPLAQRLAITRTAVQRQQILDARQRMDWTDQLPASLAELPTDSVRVIATAFHEHHLLRALGLARLSNGRQVIGLSEVNGTCTYLLDIDGAALHLLTETTHANTPRADLATRGASRERSTPAKDRQNR